MVTRLSTIFVALLLALGLIFVQVQVGSAAILHDSYRGTVISYQTGKTIGVEGKNGVKTFDVANAWTKGDIQPNDHVLVKYSNKDGRMVASSVRVIGTQSAKTEMGQTHEGQTETK